jgi:hypothetical protein
MVFRPIHGHTEKPIIVVANALPERTDHASFK